MNKKNQKGWLKHWDFILIDLVCLQVSFILTYWMIRGFENPYANTGYRYQAILLFVSQLLTIAFTNHYGGILRRKRFDELVAVCRYMIMVLLFAIFYMFLTHDTSTASRLQFGFTSVTFIVLDYLLRTANKTRILHSNQYERGKKSLLLITSSDLLEEAIQKLYPEDGYRDYLVTKVLLLDGQQEESRKIGKEEIPVLPVSDAVIQEISHDWIDEAFLLQPDDLVFPKKLMDAFMTMGITVNYTVSAIGNENWSHVDVRKLGDYKVITNGVKFVSGWQLVVKRLMDIAGGLVGCLLTGIVFLFVAPAIYFADPGPIFFKQKRVGRNGKIFELHKFRSMYMDAEERKAALMAQNDNQDGMMFKMTDDPRIIGSEKKDKDGNPKGIGNFIRRTSLDEFPQFYDCLIGNMSLVGWRPCTLDEWEKYDIQHRIRASMNPGITGMWQVSGRSTIKNFDDVVRLDKEYIENWSLLLDIKILLKTIIVVFNRKGAE